MRNLQTTIPVPTSTSIKNQATYLYLNQNLISRLSIKIIFYKNQCFTDELPLFQTLKSNKYL